MPRTTNVHISTTTKWKSCQKISTFIYTGWCQNTILCLIPRTTVTSLIASKNTRCKMHPLCVNLGVPFWMREKTHKLCAWWQASSSGIRADVMAVLEVRQSIDHGVGCKKKGWLPQLNLYRFPYKLLLARLSIRWQSLTTQRLTYLRIWYILFTYDLISSTA